MKTKLLAILFLAGTSLFAGPRVSIGVGIGGPAYGPGYYAPPPPIPAYAYASRYARPGYSWIDGYWYPVGPRYQWRGGYWARPPYAGARWVGPRYYRNSYYRGYWRR
jgi:hypothetical protein